MAYKLHKIIVFGLQDLAQLANYYIESDTGHSVVAFSANKEYCNKETFEGKPVVPFENIEKLYSPSEYLFFAPMTGAEMNKRRQNVYEAIKQKGYTCYSYVSSRISKFNNKIGENCFILEDNTLQPYTDIGNNVVIWSGCHIGHHSKIEDHVFFTSHVVMSGHCTVGKNSWFGVNSTIRDGANIAEGTLLAMGACLVSKETKPWTGYLGVPAKPSDKSSLMLNP